MAFLSFKSITAPLAEEWHNSDVCLNCYTKSIKIGFITYCFLRINQNYIKFIIFVKFYIS